MGWGDDTARFNWILVFGVSAKNVQPLTRAHNACIYTL